MAQHQAFYNQHKPKSTESIFEHVLAQIEPQAGAIAYDLCCGTGQLSAQLSQKGYRVYGIDIASQFIGKEGLGQAEFCIADVDMLPFANTSADLITCIDSLQYFPDFAATLHEMARVLKPGGILILSCQNNYNPAGIKKWVMQSLTGKVWSPWLAHPVENFILYPQLRAILKAQGLQVDYVRGKQFLTAWVSLLPGAVRNWAPWPNKPWRTLASLAARLHLSAFIEESFLSRFAMIVLVRVRKHYSNDAQPMLYG